MKFFRRSYPSLLYRVSYPNVAESVFANVRSRLKLRTDAVVRVYALMVSHLSYPDINDQAS